MRDHALTPIPELEIESETVHTWEIWDWRDLPRKARGPKFECGGHPWYAPEATLPVLLSKVPKEISDCPVGECSCFPMATTLTMHPFILSKGTKRGIGSLQMAGMPVHNLRSFYGTRTILLFTLYTVRGGDIHSGNYVADYICQLRITDSMLRRATGVSHGLQRYENFSHPIGRTKDVRW